MNYHSTDTKPPETFVPFRSSAARARYHAWYRERAADWPVPAEERMVTTSYGETLVRVSGPPTAPPLVLLPGARTASLMWAPNIAALAARHRTYAVDLITDVGLSVARVALSRPAHLVAWLDELLVALVPDAPLALLGLSYGGWLASRYALAHPARLRALVLLAPAATILPFAPSFVLRMLTTLIPHRGLQRWALHWLFAETLRSGAVGRAQIEGFLDDLMLATRCFDPRHAPKLIGPGVLSAADWGRLAVPALILLGEHERIYAPARATRRLQRVAPQVQVSLIAGAGHDLTTLRADAVGEQVLAFLKAAW